MVIYLKIILNTPFIIIVTINENVNENARQLGRLWARHVNSIYPIQVTRSWSIAANVVNPAQNCNSG